MKSVMLDCQERWSVRMDRLCESLGLEPGRPSHRGRVWEAYTTWLCKWAGDEETDSGVFFGVDLKTLGEWAGWQDPRKFGRALVQVGYVHPLEDKYPAKVLRGRTGFVAWGALDVSWHGWHGKRSGRQELVLFLADRERRSAAALALGLDPEKWKGWLLGRDELVALRGRRAGATGQEIDAAAAPRGGPGSWPEDGPGDAAPAGAASGPPPPPLTFRHVQNVREEKISQRERTQETATKRSGIPPSKDQFDALRRHRAAGDARACLDELDRSTWFRTLADEVCERDPLFVLDAIGEMVESWHVYRSVHWPPALINKRLRIHLAKLRRDEARAEEGEGGGRKIIGFNAQGPAVPDDHPERIAARKAIAESLRLGSPPEAGKAPGVA